MAFKFSLEKLLEIRKKERDQKFIAWSDENNKLTKILDEEKSIKKELLDNKSKYSELYKNKDIQGVKLLHMYIGTFKFKIEDVKNRINEQKQNVESFRLRLFESNFKFKTIERLKEVKKSEYIKTENKKEEKYIDELNVMRHKRGNKIGSV